MEVLLSFGLQWIIFVETLFVSLLLSDLFYQEFFELHLWIDELLFYVSKDFRVDDSLSAKQWYFMFLITDYCAYSVGSGVNLFEVILEFFNFPLKCFYVLKVDVSDRISFYFAIIIHSVFDSFDNGLKFELNCYEKVHFCISRFKAFLWDGWPRPWARKSYRW